MCLFLEDNVKAPHFLADGAPPRPGFPQYHYWIHTWEFVPSVMGYATEWLTGEFTGWPHLRTAWGLRSSGHAASPPILGSPICGCP